MEDNLNLFLKTRMMTSEKNGRWRQKKMEDDLKKTMEDDLQK